MDALLMQQRRDLATGMPGIIVTSVVGAAGGGVVRIDSTAP